MIRFGTLEKLGISVAAISEIIDGDLRIKNSEDIQDNIDSRSSFLEGFQLQLSKLVCAQQVHGTNVVCVTDKDIGKGTIDYATAIPETDGLITDTRGISLGILIADCVPVFLFDSQSRAGGILHAGREGTLHNICAQGVSLMCNCFGSDPSSIHAIIGPSAGPCCYEVSELIAHDFVVSGLSVSGRFLDLWKSNKKQLSTAGIPEDQISISQICTVCDGRFHSYRRGKKAGRNLAILSL